jgi:hypothetical protein
MRIMSKLFILLVVGIIAVVILNVLVNLNAETFLISSDGTAGSDELASPTLLAPVQEPDTNTVSDQNYNCLIYLLGLIGIIGIMVISINYMKRNR